MADTSSDRWCPECGAMLKDGYQHRHMDPNWKPLYEDFEGALEGYESVAIAKSEEEE